MPSGDIETFHEAGVWKDREQGSDPILSSHDTKQRAVEASRSLAQSRRVEHIIKNMDGTIGERNSYGNNPRDVKG